MQQQTWIITFSDSSSAQASQNAGELAKLLQATFDEADITITLEKSNNYTQAFWDKVIAQVPWKLVPALLGKVATFLSRKPLPNSELTIEAQVGKLKLSVKASDENFRHTIDQVLPIVQKIVDNPGSREASMIPVITESASSDLRAESTSIISIEMVEDENVGESDNTK